MARAKSSNGNDAAVSRAKMNNQKNDIDSLIELVHAHKRRHQLHRPNRTVCASNALRTITTTTTTTTTTNCNLVEHSEAHDGHGNGENECDFEEEEQQEDKQQQTRERQRCQAMLSKLNKVLPKILRSITSLSSDQAVIMIQSVCVLLNLLLDGEVCPFSMHFFQDEVASSALASGLGTTSNAGGAACTSASTFPTTATLLFYLVVFFTNRLLVQAHRNVSQVLLKLVFVLSWSDLHSFLHFVHDCVTLVEDCAVVELHVVTKVVTQNHFPLQIANFLRTAMHVYQHVEPPLGSRHEQCLCGCFETSSDDEHEHGHAHARTKYETRVQQLKALLPPIRVHSLDEIRALRRSIMQLLAEILATEDTAVSNHAVFVTLCELMVLLMQCSTTSIHDTHGFLLRDEELQLVHRMIGLCRRRPVLFTKLAVAFLQSIRVALIGENPAIDALQTQIVCEIHDSLRLQSMDTFDLLWPSLDGILRTLELERAQGEASKLLEQLMALAKWGSREAHHSHATIACMEIILQSSRVLHEVSVCSRDEVLGDLVSFLCDESIGICCFRNLFKAFPIKLIEMNQVNHNEENDQMNRRSRKRLRVSLESSTSCTDTTTSYSGSRIFPSNNVARLDEQAVRLSQWLLNLLHTPKLALKDRICGFSSAFFVIMCFRSALLESEQPESTDMIRSLLDRAESLLSDVLEEMDDPSGCFELVLQLVVFCNDEELPRFAHLIHEILGTPSTRMNASIQQHFCDPGLNSLALVDAYGFRTEHHDWSPWSHDLRKRIQALQSFFSRFRKWDMSIQIAFLSTWIWTRPNEIGLGADNWKACVAIRSLDTPSNGCSELLLCGYVGMTPLLVGLLHHVVGISKNEVIQCILEKLASVLVESSALSVKTAVLAAFGAVMCVSTDLTHVKPLLERVTKCYDGTTSWLALQHSCTCDTHHQNAVASCAKSNAQVMHHLKSILETQRIAKEIDVEHQHQGPLNNKEPATMMTSLHIQLVKSRTCLMCHAYAVDETMDVVQQNLCLVFRGLCDPDAEIRDTANDCIAKFFHGQKSMEFSKNSWTDNPIVHQLLDLSSTAKTIDADKETALDSNVAIALRQVFQKAFGSPAPQKQHLLLSVVTCMGTLGSSVNFHHGNEADVIIWMLLQLVIIWNKHPSNPQLQTSCFCQIQRILLSHNVTWRDLCLEHPEQVYFILVHELLKSSRLRLFLDTFVDGNMKICDFLLVSAPYVLPSYVLAQSDAKLDAFVSACNQELCEGDNGSSAAGDSAAVITATKVVVNNLEYILKAIIMHQVQAVKKENRIAEWAFLFKYLPEHSTMGDVIRYAPLRLLNLLAWEMGGSQARIAKRSMITVCQYLHGKSKEEEEKETTSTMLSVDDRGDNRFVMPLQFFLALMTDLGNKISTKSQHCSVAYRIRAISSIHQIFAIFASQREPMDAQGCVDPFVPKVMAIIKTGLSEKALQKHAIEAWDTFVRMLSNKALESSLCSIMVSLLPCLGFNERTVLQQVAPDAGVWNIDVLCNASGSQTCSISESESVTDEWVEPSVRECAIGLLKYLIVDKRRDLKQAFPRISLLPNLPELDEVYVVLEAEVGDPVHKPIQEYLADLSVYVTHWDVAVRQMALAQLYRALIWRNREIQDDLIRNEGALNVDKVIADILAALLQLATTESNDNLKLLCARCLGALGAIDAARIPPESSLASGRSLSQGNGRIGTRAELSTKDLACTLIETWLVKELRAAPQNTDFVAYAIQELLRFLADLTEDPQNCGSALDAVNRRKSRKPQTRIMPEWMKRRFERKEVLQFVEPYWSTNYSISNNKEENGSKRSSKSSSAAAASAASSSSAAAAAGPGTAGSKEAAPIDVDMEDESTFYENANTSYEEWLLSWCRRLIHLCQPPEKKVFVACRTALSACPQIARFLLPYLIQNSLRSGKTGVYAEIQREVMSILNDQDSFPVDDSGTTGFTQDFASQIPMMASSRPEPLTTTSSKQALSEYLSRQHQCLQTIFSTLDELNEWVWIYEKKKLAMSAGGTHSRSHHHQQLSIATATSTASSRASGDVNPSDMDDQEKENLEEFLKDISVQSLSSAAFGIKAYARSIQYFETYLRQQDWREYGDDSRPRRANPKPSEEIAHCTAPIHLSLIARNGSYLQQLYGSVDEPDALIGLATIRRLVEAQEEAAAIQSGTELQPNLIRLMHRVFDHEKLAEWEDALACYEQALQEVHSAEVGPDWHEGLKPNLYAGVVRCLVQLGRLESALQYIQGINNQDPAFISATYPLALECAWHLNRWSLLSDLIKAEKTVKLSATGSVDLFGSLPSQRTEVGQVSFVRVLSNIHGGDAHKVSQSLLNARLEVMGPLAAASTESYQRVYPLLHKLHFLHEAEQGFLVLRARQSNAGHRWDQFCDWASRFDALPTSLKFRDPILALHRMLYNEASARQEMARNWLQYAKLARKEGYFRTAASAVMHAEALGNRNSTLEKARLLVAQEKMYDALQIVEPIDVDPSQVEFDVDDRRFKAKTLLLATNWMQESGQRQGKKVIARYRAVIQYDPKWEKGYFHLARYYEYLLENARSPLSSSSSTSSTSSSTKAQNLDVSTWGNHLIVLMQNYVLALSCGTKCLFQAMPRLLTLWFEYGELLYSSSSAARRASKNKLLKLAASDADFIGTSEQQKLLNELSNVIQDATQRLPAYEWLVCFPQVISRICHPNPTVINGVKTVLIKVLAAYPSQAMWSIIGLTHSLNSQRRKHATQVVEAAQKQLRAAGQDEAAQSYDDGKELVKQLISIAGYDPQDQRRCHIHVTRFRTKILVPIQTALTTVLPASGLAPSDQTHAAFASSTQVYIRAFSDRAEVMFTKEKPKRIEILGSDGRRYPFLCKREKTGDLRKDAKMMEFNTMINKLLQKDPEGRKRKLRLRTYAVVCLNEENGLIEWVSNTRAMRQLVCQIHKTERGFIQPVRLTNDIKDKFLTMQKKYATNTSLMGLVFRRQILTLPTFTPRFHQWFLNNFPDPTAWFESRLAFTRSSAVWSMVGHIIGLGDRHLENILIDCTTGECVHVDFDCLFDKGLKLAKPEIVPFRLTPNMIDAFGVTGYEGVFRRVSEVTLALLRENHGTLRSVLEAFLHDPLVEWGRRGKMQNSAMLSSHPSNSLSELAVADPSKQETKLILKTIDDRLRGIYNLGAAVRPHVNSARLHMLPENDTLPLSVQGQVARLIQEAVSHENLAQMYIGWMPFL